MANYPATIYVPQAPVATSPRTTPTSPSAFFTAASAEIAAIEATLGAELVNVVQPSNNLRDIINSGSARANIGISTLTPAAAVATANVTSLAGFQTFDGYTLVSGDTILLVNQTTTSQNGPWLAAVGAWTRPTEFATGITINSRTILVVNGSTYPHSWWSLDAPTAGINVGTSAQTWTQIVGAGTGNMSTSTYDPAGGAKQVAFSVGPQTISNTQIQRRVSTTNAPGATPAMDTDNYDVFEFTGLATAITSMTSSLTGTPTQDQVLQINFTDNGTARALSFGASFFTNSAAIPTSTVISKRLMTLWIYNTVIGGWQFAGWM